LLHPISLPSNYGIGDIGKNAFLFVDFLKETNQTMWQILPLGKDLYCSDSAFAGNYLMIDLEDLCEIGLLKKDEINDYKNYSFNDKKINYAVVEKYKLEKLRISYKSFTATEEFIIFCNENNYWLNDYALYNALTNHLNKYWLEWDDELKNREKGALERYSEKLKEEINFYKFIQYIFTRQWQKLKKYAKENKIEIFGDIPIFVSNAIDVWAHPEIFLLDEDKRPKFISGVPPDYFSETGQLWGNPLYNWEVLKETGFRWWLERIKHILKYVDYLRIDHFRGFEAFWAVPANSKTAINGEWVKAPGDLLFETVRKELGELPIIAEDLGIITDEVVALRDKFNFPGMKILQFGFDKPESEYLPHNFTTTNCVVYTGTHDNDTIFGWLNSISEKERKNLTFYLGEIDKNNFNWQMIKLGMSSIAIFSIFPMQDILGLGSEARMNVPSLSEGNWLWRFKWEQLTEKMKENLKEYTIMYNRI
ncbi:MAG TPA: 4-alpha-glucanotransferase, partial [bacterium]|nr:4-alpha-glucanotransferase [bacterium]